MNKIQPGYDASWIGEATFRNYYHGIVTFFHKVWEQPHAYIVMSARRCFNINHFFLTMHEAQGGRAINAGRMISNNALLLYADDIAQYYQAHARFPGILIVDDLVLHGRGLAKLLSELEELIFAALPDAQNMTEDDRYYIRKSLAAAIDIHAFAINRQPLLIEDMYLKKLHGELYLYTRDIRILSRQLSAFLWKLYIPNTSYVLSYQVNALPSYGNQWRELHWDDSKAAQSAFFDLSRIGKDAVDGFLPTVRCRKPAAASQSDSSFWLTSLPLFSELPVSCLSAMCTDAAEKMEAAGLTCICRILTKEHPLLQKIRAQMISFLLSYFCLIAFLSGGGHTPSFCNDLDQTRKLFNVKKTDLDKIARNFSKIGDIKAEFEQLFSNHALCRDIFAIIRQGLRSDAALLPCPSANDPAGEAGIRSANYFLENCFYDLGMASEQAAYHAIQSNRYLASEADPGIVSLTNLCLWKQPKWSGAHSEDPPSGPQRLSSIMSMMDRGLMAMNLNLEMRNGTPVIYTSLKAGELATFSIPRRLHLFIPAMALAERDSWRIEAEAQDAVKRFIRFLLNEVENTRGTDPSPIQEDEQKALLFLESWGSQFVDTLYQCGQTVNGWDFDLITADDWAGTDDSSYLTYVQQKSARQKYYLHLACQFLAAPDANQLS